MLQYGRPSLAGLLLRRITQVFWSSFQQEFSSMSSEFTVGDNSDMSSIFCFFFKNLVDRDLTEYQITQSLTLSQLHAQLEQTKGIRLFTHRQHVDWSRQKGIRLLNQTSYLSFVVFCSMQRESDLCKSVE